MARRVSEKIMDRWRRMMHEYARNHAGEEIVMGPVRSSFFVKVDDEDGTPWYTRLIRSIARYRQRGVMPYVRTVPSLQDVEEHH